MLVCIKHGSSIKEIRWSVFWSGEVEKNNTIFSKKVIKELKVNKDHNIINLLLIIAQTQIGLPSVFYLRAFVSEDRKILIKSNKNKPAEILEINGDTESPEFIKERIINAAIVSLESSSLGERAKKGYQKSLKEKIEQIKNNTKKQDNLPKSK